MATAVRQIWHALDRLSSHSRAARTDISEVWTQMQSVTPQYCSHILCRDKCLPVMISITSSHGEQLRFIVRGHTPFSVTSRSMYRRPWVAQEARPQETVDARMFKVVNLSGIKRRMGQLTRSRTSPAHFLGRDGFTIPKIA
jgi:hypothetical protein